MNFKRQKIRKKIPEYIKINELKKDPIDPKELEPVLSEDTFSPSTDGPSTDEPPTEKPKKEKTIKIKIPLAISILIILGLFIGIAQALSNINLNVFLKVAGDELQKDQYGHTNFLVLGTGDKNHEGADLTDTIMLVSVDDENKLVSMLSIPRDLYVEDEEVGNSKINETYYHGKKYYDDERAGLEFMKMKMEELTGIEIQYWIKLNFQGFKDLIDALGGIDIFVENAIYDPYYPKAETFLYETFSIEAGQQHLDGETALKYARSRKTTSDFDRADRQQKIIYAIKEKALQTDTILSKSKVTNLLNVLKENIDTNIKVSEILTLGAIAQDYTQESITQRLLHDDPTQCGGFVYPPPLANYGGMFVLIPAGGYDTIRKYSELIFGYQQIAKENIRIYVLNGTKEYGVAGETKQVLQRYCFDVTGFGNGPVKDALTTTYYYPKKYDEKGKELETYRPVALDFLQKYIPGVESTEIAPEYQEYLLDADLIIELGQDYTDSENYMLDDFYYLGASIYSTNPINNTNGTTTNTTE